jgi:phospholipase C
VLTPGGGFAALMIAGADLMTSFLRRLAAAASMVVLAGSVAGRAEDAVDYHPVPPSAAVRPFAVAAAGEPSLSEAALWRLLRQRVKHVFVIYQENRSFDSYFGSFPGADGLFSRKPEATPGFVETLIDTDGSVKDIRPFRIGPEQYAADTDDIDHSHPLIVAKMDVTGGRPRMDKFAEVEERKYSPKGNPSLMAKQFGELAMAYEDCDTVPYLWRYADRFVLFDHIFQEVTGPSTPGNLDIIAAQTGETQWALHPEQAYKGNGAKGMGVPVVNDADPFWGSQLDPSAHKMPVNPHDFKGSPPKEYDTQRNLTFATLPLTLEGKEMKRTAAADSDPDGDLDDVKDDIRALAASGMGRIGFGWYEEGYDREPTDPGPTDASGTHAAYIAHHNGPQYFGYVANNPNMRTNLHGLADFFAAIRARKLPARSVFFIKGGYQNSLGLKPADPDPRVQKNFIGDDDHPAYSDAEISEALVAETVNTIAASPYWKESAIIITWDDSEGDYDHVPPPIRSKGPDGSIVTYGPRVPLLVISPYARVHVVAHEQGEHASVVKFVDKLFRRTPLAELPDEQRGRALGKKEFGQDDLGPSDALVEGVSDLAAAFDPARLAGRAKTLPASYALIPDALVYSLPQQTGYGCRAIGVTPVDRALGIANPIPADFNPRPKTTPTR